MAKTREQWYQVMLDEVSNYPDLSQANSSSVTALWSKFFWTVSYVAWLMDSLFHQFKIDAQEIADKSNTGTSKWYLNQTLKFQFGDNLVWDANLNKFMYPIIIEPNKIIKHAAVVFSGGEVRIKAAKDNGGILEPLNAVELTAFDAYWKTNKIAGTTLSVLSSAADDLKVEVEIIYNALVMNSDGTLIADNSFKPVLVAIDSYISNLEFDGRLWVDKLQDEIQKAEGVISVKITTIQAKYSGGNYTDVNQYYDSVAGYLTNDIANSVITYVNV